MRIVLFVFGCLSLLGGLAILVIVKSAIHEIESLILFLIAAVLIGSASVVDAVVSLKKSLTGSRSVDSQEEHVVTSPESDIAMTDNLDLEQAPKNIYRDNILFAIALCFLGVLAVVLYFIFK